MYQLNSLETYDNAYKQQQQNDMQCYGEICVNWWAFCQNLLRIDLLYFWVTYTWCQDYITCEMAILAAVVWYETAVVMVIEGLTTVQQWFTSMRDNTTMYISSQWLYNQLVFERFYSYSLGHLNCPWASCKIRKMRVAHAPGMPGVFFPPPWVSDHDMHHGTCVTHAP